MKRPRLGSTALFGCLALLAGPAAASATTPPRAALRGFACTRAIDPSNRAIAVTAVMRPVTATRRMQLRFVLQSTVDGITTRIHAGDLGTWINPANPTLGQLSGDVWNFQKEVVPLPAPATYRFRVSYRWLGAHGRVLATALRTSASCHQRELRPDLQVQSIAVAPITGHPNRDLYTALIADTGNTGAGPFTVLFAPAAGTGDQTRTVTWLRAHHQRTVSFIGPLCTSGAAPTVIADSASQVDDLNRANNTLTARCPTSTG